MSATHFHRRLWLCLINGSLCLWLTGCGKQADTPAETATATNATPADGLPTASIANNSTSESAKSADEDVPIAELKVGSPEWLLREITRVRVQPLPKEQDVDRLKQVRQERTLKIIELATEVIALTHDDPERDRLFSVGVHHLMEARLELALAGDKEQIDALYDDAASLYKRNPSSQGAEEAAFVLVKFAQANADRFADQEPRWLGEFARQARLYATNFPQDALRGPNALFAAAESCELHGLLDEAKACYTFLQQRFPDHLLATQATGILRRISAKGEPITLGGPTLDGGYISLDDLRGKTVLIVFWSSQATRFMSSVATLNSLHEKYAAQGLNIVGINLDLDDAEVLNFIKEQNIQWPQIYFSDEEQRGWNHPVANYYGIRQVPTIWLVDGTGTVRETEVSLDQLDATLPAILAENAKTQPPATTTSDDSAAESLK